ncbi:MAG TPA: sulfite exporter TauE/SafE family protein [Burkholderiales bacterium]|nr:sulfite exporter TauE/SafE family protein [Burkholderiales bacterium]HXV10950.1 sulfite exporter TauE/SafE family protein [Burkholderiales bacterium]
MEPYQVAILCASFFIVATLYTTVGHAGASGYLAMMALIGLAPDVMRPTALTLNILVASFTVYRFRQARFFSWSGLWPFLVGSVPFAAAGGIQSLSRGAYYSAMGIVLLIAALYLVLRAIGLRTAMPEGVVRVKRLPAVFMGCVIGFISGLIGVGGGIFLSPILLVLNWAGPKTTAGISAPFILINSAVALAAGSLTVQTLAPELPLLAAGAFAGAFLGTWLGLERLNQKGLLMTLAFVMSLAGLKLVLTA